MKTPYQFVLLLTSLLFVSCSSDEVKGDNLETPPENGAAYSVVFDLNWNSTDFPTDYPSGPHFSPVVGWVHSVDQTLFQENTIASSGIEQMAETGATSVLVSEMKSLVAEGKGLSTYTGSGHMGGVGSINIKIAVSKEFSAVTLATMVAPSPDWFVAGVNVNLMGEDGTFVDEKTVVGYVYDAGSDNGSTFTSPNSNTDPKIPIAKITNPPLGDGEKVNPSFCTITFTKN
jgi:hypothetical protein